VPITTKSPWQRRGRSSDVGCEQVRENVEQQTVMVALLRRTTSPSPVVPFGRHEQGQYFSLDLGGSNLRVMFVKLSRQHGQVVRNVPRAHCQHDTHERLHDSHTTHKSGTGPRAVTLQRSRMCCACPLAGCMRKQGMIILVGRRYLGTSPRT
jgi:hypothetical protein